MKRILSLIIATAMVISLLPAVTLFAAAEGETVYTFSTTALNEENGLTGVSPSQYHRVEAIYKNTSGVTDNFNFKYVCGTAGHGWKHFGHAAKETDVVLNMRHMQLRANDILSTINNASYGIVSQLDLGFELKPPAEGFYTVLYETNVSYGVTGYMGPKKSADIADYTNEEHLLGNVSVANAVKAYPGKVVYSDGTTPLVYVFRTTTNVATRSLTLEPVTGTPEIYISSAELLPGENATVSVRLGNKDVVGSFVSFESRYKDVADVDGKGIITAVSPGWTVLTVTVGDFKGKALVGVKNASGEIPGDKPSLEPEPSFPYEFMHKGESIKIENATASYTYSSSKPEVATVSADGVVTAKALGRTAVTAKKDGEEDIVFEIAVVGENLINRNGIDHGHFENGIYFSDGSDAKDKNDSFWEATRRSDPEAANYLEYIFDFAYEDILIPGRANKVKGIRFSFDGNAPVDPKRNRVSLVVQPPKSKQATAGDNRGMIIAEPGKMYEFTGWTAAENTEVLGDMWNTIAFFNLEEDGKTYTEFYGQSIKPWDGKSGNQPWQMFNTFPVIVDSSVYNNVYMRPVMHSVSGTKIGDIVATEFSVHEVVYDSMELSASKTEIEASEITTLSAKHFSNTGNAIKQISNKKPVDAVVPVTYESDNTDVVRVMDDNGTIIGVSDGTATITATATICGVTVSEDIEIKVSGGTRPEFIGSMELVIQGESIYPASYATTVLTVKNENGEAMTLEADELTYESSDTEVATVTSNGVIRAKTAGEATITVKAKRFGLEKTATAQITVLPLPQEENFPEVIGAYFTTDHTYVGGENSIIVTDLYGRKLGGGVTYAYEIADNSVISETGGTFTGKKIGRTIVTVSATLDGVTRTADVPAVVVGNNLLIRKGVNHGELENGIYITDGSSDTEKDSSFWSAARTEGRGLYTYELLRNQFSGIVGAPTSPTNIVKFTMPDGETAEKMKLVRVQGSKDAYNEAGTKHTGLVLVDANKLYEFSGYIKAENVNPLPENTCGSLAYLSGSGSSSTELKGYKATPWVGKTGDQGWTRFNIAPVVMNWPSVKEYNLRPGFEALTDDQNHGYELSVAHLSLHEVVFDSIAFSASGDFSKAKTYDTFETTARLLSNTGAEIAVGNANAPIEITYSSDDESVARISEDGVITAVSDGTTKVRAYATVLGVSKTAEMEVDFSGLEVMFDRVDVSVDTELDVGDTAQITTVPKNTDDSLFEGDVEIYFESTNTAVATVSKDGLVTARKSGETEINIYGILGERREKTTVKIIVNDITPLETVTVSGSDTVEKGFTLKLLAQAVHESGSAADMDESLVVFELAPGADESILSITDDGVVTGKEVGRASVIVTVTAKNGSSKTSDPFEIEVVPQSPKSKVFDFTKYPVNTSVLNQTIENDGFEINRDLSSPGILSGVLNSCRYLAFGISSVVSATGNTKNADTVLDVKIDYDGWYEIDFKGALNHSGAGLAYIYMDGTYLGEYRFYDPVDQADVPAVNLNTIYLDARVHQLTIRSIESGETGTMAAHTRSHTVSGITFRYLTEDPVVCDPVMTAERTSLAVGESVALDVQVPLSNGRVHSFGKRHGETADTESSLNITSEPSSVVEYKNGESRQRQRVMQQLLQVRLFTKSPRRAQLILP